MARTHAETRGPGYARWLRVALLTIAVGGSASHATASPDELLAAARAWYRSVDAADLTTTVDGVDADSLRLTTVARSVRGRPALFGDETVSADGRSAWMSMRTGAGETWLLTWGRGTEGWRLLRIESQDRRLFYVHTLHPRREAWPSTAAVADTPEGVVVRLATAWRTKGRRPSEAQLEAEYLAPAGADDRRTYPDVLEALAERGLPEVTDVVEAGPPDARSATGRLGRSVTLRFARVEGGWRIRSATRLESGRSMPVPEATRRAARAAADRFLVAVSAGDTEALSTFVLDRTGLTPTPVTAGRVREWLDAAIEPGTRSLSVMTDGEVWKHDGGVSYLLRSRETAAPVVAAHFHLVSIDAGWRVLDFRAYDGSELVKIDPDDIIVR